MKKIFTLIIGIILSTVILNSQVAPPQAFSYKATINKSNGQPVASQVISFRISILKNNSSGMAVYIEKFSPLTNTLGQIDIQIGRGTPQLGDFPSIDWSNDKYFLKTEVDIKGGTAYQELSITQLLSVPYALFAGSAGSAIQYNELDPVFSTSAAHSISSGSINNWNTSFSWGDHHGLYKPSNYKPTWSEITNPPSSLSGYGITDAMSTSHPANGITADNIANWNTTYSWGNHALAGYVPNTRKITINGTAYDLLDDRSWSVGTVTLVGLSLPNIFSVVGSPVTGSGTLTATLASQPANRIFASPIGGSGVPSFRALDYDDIPPLDWSKIISGKPNTLSGYGITDGVNTTGSQTINGNKTFTGSVVIGSAGKVISEIREITGVTATDMNFAYVQYPAGYYLDNTRVLSVEVMWMNSSWETAGMSHNESYAVACYLLSQGIMLQYPPLDGFYGQAFRILLMKVQ